MSAPPPHGHLVDMTGEITPDTHVRMSVPKFLGVIAGIVGIVAAGLGLWYGVNGVIRDLTKDLAAHIADTDRHLDRDWQKDHGRPVGLTDLNLLKIEQNRMLESIAADAKASRDMVRSLTLPRRRREEP